MSTGYGPGAYFWGRTLPCHGPSSAALVDADHQELHSTVTSATLWLITRGSKGFDSFISR